MFLYLFVFFLFFHLFIFMKSNFLFLEAQANVFPLGFLASPSTRREVQGFYKDVELGTPAYSEDDIKESKNDYQTNS